MRPTKKSGAMWDAPVIFWGDGGSKNGRNAGEQTVVCYDGERCRGGDERLKQGRKVRKRRVGSVRCGRRR